MKLKDKEVWKLPSTMLGISVSFSLIPFPAVRVMEARTDGILMCRARGWFWL